VDRRLIVTVAFVGYALGLAALAVATVAAAVEFTEAQPTFLSLVGVATPLAGLSLIWVGNYVYGAPLFAVSTAATAWFVGYFFLVHDNPASVGAVPGDLAAAYRYAAVMAVLGATVAALVGTWLWYRESPGFRSLVDGVIEPPSAR